jgi:FAD-linked oxidoreductase
VAAASPSSWRNWAGNQQAQPQHVFTPRNTEDVVEAIGFAAGVRLPVRMAGTGHSFSGAALTDGVLLRPEGLTALRSVDTHSGLVTAEAGMRLRELNRHLAEHGRALANMGDIAEQTIAGAAQTATHGTGRDTGGLVSQIAALELVLADGTVATCSATEGPDLFAAACAGLGSLGIITAITWRTVPAFTLHAREEPMRWHEVLDGLDDLTEDNEHFEFYWFPHTDGCLTKRNNRRLGTAGPGGPATEPVSRARRWVDDELLSNAGFGLTNMVGHWLPGTIKPLNRFAVKALGARTYTDRSDRVFTSPRRVRFKEQEYAIPRAELHAVLCEVRSLFERRNWLVSFPIEVRVLPAEDAWLSMAHWRPSAFIAVHVYRRTPHEEYFGGIEEIMAAVGGRPHWGKLHTRDAAYFRDVYPRFADFQALRDQLDPERRFANAYTDRVLGR